MANILAVFGILLVFGMKSAEESAAVILPQGEASKLSQISEVKMLVVGDIMLGRNVELLSDKFGADYPFKNISGFLSQFDIVSGNLEGPIVAGAPKTEINSFKFTFPISSPAILKSAGFNILSLANNHAVDFGDRGYSETAARLTEEGIISFGHPVSASAGYIARKEFYGRRITFFGYNATYPSFDKKETLAAISSERSSAPEEPIFIYMHWGEEYSLDANEFQKQLAHELIDAGATAIFGSHPHVTEGIEVYKNRAIFYSLGNFIFDQYFSKDTQEALAVSAIIGGGNVVYYLNPLASKRSQPALMDSSVAAPWLNNLAQRSDPAIREMVSSGSIILPL